VDDAAENNIQAFDAPAGCVGHRTGRSPDRHVEVEAPVRTSPTVAVHEHGQHHARGGRRCRSGSGPGTRSAPCARSAQAVAPGERGQIFNTSTPAAANTASNPVLNVVSRSRIRNRNRRSVRPSRPIARLRARPVTHPPPGCAVIPASCTVRRSTSMTNTTQSLPRPTVSTVQKSQTTVPAARAGRNRTRLGSLRRLGAEPGPWPRRTLRTDLAVTSRPQRYVVAPARVARGVRTRQSWTKLALLDATQRHPDTPMTPNRRAL